MHHSILFTTKRKVRVCEDIVHLLQQKNLMLEYYGKRHQKVGEIEERVGLRMRVSRDLVNDANYFVRKLAVEAQEGAHICAILEQELQTHAQVSDSMQ